MYTWGTRKHWESKDRLGRQRQFTKGTTAMAPRRLRIPLPLGAQENDSEQKAYEYAHFSKSLQVNASWQSNLLLRTFSFDASQYIT